MKNSILLVDDEPNLRELLRHMLEIGGFEVIEAEDGFDALDKLAENTPDMMILDVMMPNLDGVSLCKQLRATARFATLPIVMLSGKTQYHAVQEGLAAGANRYLCKPITVNELIQTVREVLSAPAALSGSR
ncbi:MAG: response regulator [Ardenticatenaceae bacterium]|nr:response regulator [Anaerolineales bacterium]MCB8942123.1 response regulator [Ardenticatenaceae bacterium]MCB8973147.1 response regulator [Ardenticatenaceae bacterium]